MNLLILDLDETLIYSTEAPLDRSHDFETGPYLVYKRPFVDEFIRHASALFQLAVWTSSNQLYASSVVPQLFPADVPLAFVWARDKCTATFDPGMYRHEWAKNLNKVRRLGHSLEQVIMVDDTPTKLTRHYGNLIRVTSFEGDPADDELPKLGRYLVQIAKSPNVRQIEKRNWREQVSDEVGIARHVV